MIEYVDVDFSRTWLKKNILHMSDDEIRENKELIEQDKQAALEAGTAEPAPTGEEGAEAPAGEEGAEGPEGTFTPAGEEGAEAPAPEGGEAPETQEVKNYKGSMANIQNRLSAGFARGGKKA